MLAAKNVRNLSARVLTIATTGSDHRPAGVEKRAETPMARGDRRVAGVIMPSYGCGREKKHRQSGGGIARGGASRAGSQSGGMTEHLPVGKVIKR